MTVQARPRGTVPVGGAPLPPRVLLAMLVLCAVWGLNTVAMKVGVEGIPPVLQAGLRSLVAAPLLLLWCRWRGVALGDWRRDGTLLPGLAVGGVFGLEFLFLYTGLGRTTASRAVVFLYTAPFFVAAGAHFLLPDDRMTPAKTAGLGIAFLGVVAAFAEGLGAPAAGDAASLLGDAMCLLAGALWAATTLMLRTTRLRAAPPALALLYQLAVSAPLLLIASVLLGEDFAAVRFTPLVLAAFLYQAAGVAAVSYLIWFQLIARHSTSRLSAFSVLTPVFGVLAGVALLGERAGPLFGVAVALVAAGLWLVNRPPPGARATRAA